MTWSDLTLNWADSFQRIKARFPELQDGDMPFLKLDRDRFEAHLAASHRMTLTEAREEFEDFLFVERLSREIGGS